MQVKLSLTRPAWADVESLARIFGPASFTYFCKNLCYLMMQVRCACHHLSSSFLCFGESQVTSSKSVLSMQPPAIGA